MTSFGLREMPTASSERRRLPAVLLSNPPSFMRLALHIIEKPEARRNVIEAHAYQSPKSPTASSTALAASTGFPPRWPMRRPYADNEIIRPTGITCDERRKHTEQIEGRSPCKDLRNTQRCHHNGLSRQRCLCGRRHGCQRANASRKLA